MSWVKNLPEWIKENHNKPLPHQMPARSALAVRKRVIL